jgi:hypothetical protein
MGAMSSANRHGDLLCLHQGSWKNLDPFLHDVVKTGFKNKLKRCLPHQAATTANEGGSWTLPGSRFHILPTKKAE